MPILFTRERRLTDLGCGAGVPATKLLKEKDFDVLWLDISAEPNRHRGRRNEAQMESSDVQEDPGIAAGCRSRGVSRALSDSLFVLKAQLKKNWQLVKGSLESQPR